MADRDIGRMGQSEFEKLCTDGGLNRNVSHEDKTGWDYLVEFPIIRIPGQPADMAPSALECRVQVKATDKHRRRWDIPLQNCERLAKSPMPAFICLLEFNGELSAQNVYLVHVGEHIIRRTLERLRRSEKPSGQHARRPTLSIRCDDSHQLRELTGDCLKRTIEKCVPDGAERYRERKHHLLQTLGYENGYGYVQMQILGHDPTQEFIDLSLGLRKSVKVDRILASDIRFNVDCPLPWSPGPAELSMSPASSNGTVLFRRRKASPGIEFSADVYCPPINRLVPKERITLRVVSRLFEFLVCPFGAGGNFSFSPDSGGIPVGLSEAKNFALLMCMMKDCGGDGIWIEVTVNGHSHAVGQVTIEQTDDWSDVSVTLEQALAVARAYGIEDKACVCMKGIAEQRQSIAAFHNIIQGKSEGITATFVVDKELTQIDSTNGAIFGVGLPFGDYLLYCVVGMTGTLKQIGDRQYGFTPRGQCLYRSAMAKRGEDLDRAELRTITAEVQAEMEAEGIRVVVVSAYDE